MIKLSKILRHDSEGLAVDDFGYIACDDICKHLNISMDQLKEIVADDKKGRFALSDDLTMIKATQGHSEGYLKKIDYTQIIKPTEFEKYIFHGTCQKYWDLIKQDGFIKPMGRQFVQWSYNIKVANVRAEQRKNWTKTEPVIIRLNVEDYLINPNNKLYLSTNNVYLTPEVPIRFLHTTPLTIDNL